jgi:dolichyl-phosphate beta-glucosyltransferase
VVDTNSDILLSIIIPAFMEEKNIASTIASLREYFSQRPYKVGIIVVDDGSTDSTYEIAQNSGATVIRFENNRGKGAAVKAGMLHAAQGPAKYLLFTDADHPYEIDAVESCIMEFEKGAEVVIGSRNLPESNRGRERMKRKFISRTGNLISRIFILPGISDTQAGFKCFTRDAAQKIFSKTLIGQWGFDIEALYIARILKIKIREVPIKLISRPIQPSRLRSPIGTAINVFGSIFAVHANRIMGKYN